MDREALRSRIKELGFDVVRFARLDQPSDGMAGALNTWLRAGYQADMEWIGRNADRRTDPSRVLAGARSAIVLGVNYWPASKAPMGRATWARYAQYRDYHESLKPGLMAVGRLLEEWAGLTSEQYRYYVDTGPVLERGWAERAGLGFIGKNAMLISREYGNWLFLAEVLTVLDIEADAPLPGLAPRTGKAEKGRIGLHCGNCTRCIDACPTQAICSPGVVDARRCVSYQTIENKGIIPRELRAGIGARIYGCDVCLEVCPWNRFAQESRRVLLDARYDIAQISLSELLAMTPERFAEVFRKTPMKRTKLTGLLRNACIVAGNTRAADCLDAVVALAAHSSEMVRAHAVWAVFRMVDATTAAGLLDAPRSVEQDPAVLAEYAAESGG